MFIQITDPADNTRILLNASCILMVRTTASGGSTVYLSTSASHHPDVLLARETPEVIRRLLMEAGVPISGDVTGGAAVAGAVAPVESARPAH